MMCPVRTSPLRPVDRGGIEIDVCPQCRGVWLDRGELDKMLGTPRCPTGHGKVAAMKMTATMVIATPTNTVHTSRKKRRASSIGCSISINIRICCSAAAGQ